jgi:hypothetical protein
MSTTAAMAIKRAGPPTTHDSVMWRVPLSAPPSRVWEQAFRAADESTTIATAKGVQFERTALTFRSDEEHVPEWIEYIDRWIAHANQAQADLDDGHRREAEHIQQQSDARRQKASDANERFKHL